MWIAMNDCGVYIREDDIIRIQIKTIKSRGRGKPKYKLVSIDQITGYEQELITFDDYTKASESLYRIVTALDERKSRVELGDFS